MAEYTPHTRSMFTACFSSEASDTPARHPGFVTRASKITGTRFLARVTVGVWRAAKTPRAQLAAQGPPVAAQREVAPEARHQRMNNSALVFLPALLRHALANIHTLATAGDDGLCACCSKGDIADSTGCGRPANLPDLFPGSGGSAAKAGAKMQAVGEYTTGGFGHCALPPGNLPEQKYLDPGIGCAQHGALLLFDCGACKRHAWARIAAAGAYCCTRRNPQTNLWTAGARGRPPLVLAQGRQTVEANRHEHPVLLGPQSAAPIPSYCRAYARSHRQRSPEHREEKGQDKRRHAFHLASVMAGMAPLYQQCPFHTLAA
jgi:hypothetical protein